MTDAAHPDAEFETFFRAFTNFDDVAAQEAAFRANGWTWTGPTDDEPWVRHLDSESVDGCSELRTFLRCLPTFVHVQTRYTFALPRSCMVEARRACAAINRVNWDGPLTVLPEGTPILRTKAWLHPPEEAAAAMIARAVERNRGWARALLPLLREIADGASAETVFDGLAFAGALELQHGAIRGTELDFRPYADLFGRVEDAVARGEATLEQAALARYGLVLQEIDDLEQLPVCVGPLVIHMDGVCECYGCTNPLDRLHQGGSGSCRPGREFGVGHRCERCADLRGS